MTELKDKKKYEILGSAFLTEVPKFWADVDIYPFYDPENPESVIQARFWSLSRIIEEMNKLPPDTKISCHKRVAIGLKDLI